MQEVTAKAPAGDWVSDPAVGRDPLQMLSLPIFKESIMPCLRSRHLGVLALMSFTLMVQAQDLHSKTNTSNNMQTSSVLLAQAQQPGVPYQFQNGMAGTPGSVPVAAPQALGPKAPGKIRIGVAPSQAQLGQGNNAQADYSTPIRNSIVVLMSGPAVEVVALDARIPIQVQAEAQQKECDYILYSSVEVKHGGGGFGKFMKAAGPMSSMIPMAGMGGGMGGMVASQAASAAMQTAAMSQQQQAMNQLAGFNGQIKSKDDVTVGYQLYPTGQPVAKLQNSLKAKAKSDGEDVMTPLIQQAANTILTEAIKK